MDLRERGENVRVGSRSSLAAAANPQTMSLQPAAPASPLPVVLVLAQSQLRERLDSGVAARLAKGSLGDEAAGATGRTTGTSSQWW